MSESLISIIVPVYNVEKYINRCLESIVHQTYSNLEIILINDGSTDNSSLICDYWSKKDNRIKVIHSINRGVSVARNKGLEIAKGEYIGFVDPDDWIETDMFEYLLKLIKKNKADIAHCGFFKSNGTNHIEGLGKGIELNCNNIEGITECLKLEKFILSVWNKLYKKEILVDVFFEEGKYYEDMMFNILAFKNATSTVYSGVAKYYYFTREGSITKSNFSKRKLDIIYFTDKICNLIGKYYPQLIEYAQVKDIVENILILPDLKNNKMNNEYKKSIEKLRSYRKIKNKVLPVRYKALLNILTVSESLGVAIIEKRLNR